MSTSFIQSPTVLAAKPLLEQGLTNPQIARQLGVSPQYVSQLRYRLGGKKNKGAVEKTHGSMDRIAISLRFADLEVLAAKAADREIKTATLIRRLMEAIVQDNLIDAVLDDGKPAMQAAE